MSLLAYAAAALLITTAFAALLAAVYWLGWAAIEAAMGGAPPHE